MLAGCLVAVLGAIHIFAGRLRFLDAQPRSRWLSAASGVSVAYVFVHILPDLEHHQRAIRTYVPLPLLQYHVYLVALIGLVVFYGLERMAKRSREASPGKVTAPGVFWIHISSFAVYNALIGYLVLHREVPGARSLVLFGVAMATHFLVNDNALRRDHKLRYTSYGRWLLACGAVVGWVAGRLATLHPVALAALFGFLAGGVVLNVLKEELPEERQSRFWAFALATAAYSAVLIAV